MINYLLLSVILLLYYKYMYSQRSAVFDLISSLAVLRYNQRAVLSLCQPCSCQSTPFILNDIVCISVLFLLFDLLLKVLASPQCPVFILFFF